MKKTALKFLAVALLSCLTTASALAIIAVPSLFSDSSSFESWYADSANALNVAGVINGNPDGSFAPNDPVNRAQLAVMLDRFAKNVVGQELPSEQQMCTLDLRSGLVVELKNQDGEPVSGATISVNDGQETITESNSNIGNYAGIFEGEGYYTFEVQSDGHASHIETIKLEQDSCHVITQYRTITVAELQVQPLL